MHVAGEIETTLSCFQLFVAGILKVLLLRFRQERSTDSQKLQRLGDDLFSACGAAEDRARSRRRDDQFVRGLKLRIFRLAQRAKETTLTPIDQTRFDIESPHPPTEWQMNRNIA